MATFQERYLAGAHEEVWNELTALGPGVRHEFYYEDAVAVARETMRRVRHNVDLLFPRLHELGYEFRSEKRALESHISRMEQVFDITRFKSNPGMASAYSSIPGLEEKLAGLMESGTGSDGIHPQLEAMIRKTREQMAQMRPRMEEMREKLKARAAAQPVVELPWEDRSLFDPPGAHAAEELDALEAQVGGPLPLSLRAWYELVGGISFMGSHETLNSNNESDGLADPLVITPLSGVIGMLGGEDEEDEEGVLLELAPDVFHKADISGGAPYSIRVPNPAADAPFLYEGNNTNFVPYLRRAFAWGGFPGIEGRVTKPEKELNFLRQGLLPF
jgi:hypothetical protein